MFAAFSVAYRFQQSVDGGRAWFFASGAFGWCIVLMIAVAAAAAGAAWWETFEPEWPCGALPWIQAGGLAAGIVMQPIFAGVINWQGRNE